MAKAQWTEQVCTSDSTSDKLRHEYFAKIIKVKRAIYQSQNPIRDIFKDRQLSVSTLLGGG
jgi:hypothetical protein